MGREAMQAGSGPVSLLSFCLEVSSHISVPFDYLENNMDNTVGK